MKRILTVDLGNSAAKLVVWSLDAAPRPLLSLRWVPGQDPRALRELDCPRALLSCVGAPSVRSELEAALPMPLHVPECGLAIDLPEPDRLGRDRLFAARGALELCRRQANGSAGESGSAQALILDAGTALTVDALGMRGGEPAFLGGAIAPGPELLSRAMGRGAAQLFEVETRGLEPERVPALGRSTREALESGIVHGLRGAARELVERIAQTAGLEQAPVFLCGGAAPLLHDARLFPGHVLHLEPLLVHRGLLAADRASS